MIRTRLAVITGILFCAAALLGAAEPAPAADTHTLTGLLSSKGEDWILVKSDQDKARCETADKTLIAAIEKLVVPSRVTVVWKVDGDKKTLVRVAAAGEAGNATVQGVVTAKGQNWIEIKLPNGTTEKYMVYYKENPNEMIAKIAKTAIGAHVKIEWMYHEHNRVIKLDEIPEGSANPAK